MTRHSRATFNATARGGRRSDAGSGDGVTATDVGAIAGVFGLAADFFDLRDMD
jgi:hypothetical protein